MNRLIKPGLWLSCGCCGSGFKTWEGYEDQDQDAGYGICQPCQADTEMDTIEHYVGLFHQVENKLKRQIAEGSEKSYSILAKFQNADTDERVGYINYLMDKGFFTLSIGA